IRTPLVREFILKFLSTYRMSDMEMGLDVADILCFQLGGARRMMTWRQFILSDLLGPSPSYVFIRDPMRRLCRMMIAYSISGKEKAPEKGHFIGCLAAYFGLVIDHGLRGLSVVTHELSLIDLHEFRRLNVCLRVGDTWAWVALGPERQPDATAGAFGAADDAPALDEGA
nr:hypothetical protein [Tanacetum cinerariifolium]